jgi:hypothetical protein
MVYDWLQFTANLALAQGVAALLQQFPMRWQIVREHHNLVTLRLYRVICCLAPERMIPAQHRQTDAVAWHIVWITKQRVLR